MQVVSLVVRMNPKLTLKLNSISSFNFRLLNNVRIFTETNFGCYCSTGLCVDPSEMEKFSTNDSCEKGDSQHNAYRW